MTSAFAGTTMSMSAHHISVMLNECTDLLTPPLAREGAVYVDCTLGLGGHASAVLERSPHARLIGIDRDQQAISVAKQNLAKFGDRVSIIHSANDALADIVAEFAPSGVDAILFDLGVSSLQLDTPERGFSYLADAPLDMRMDQTSEINALDLLAEADVETLADWFKTYGGETYAFPIAQAIVDRAGRITTTGELVEVIESVVPDKIKYGPGHSAKRVFQALRVVVNDELGILARAIPAALDSLRAGGRLVVMSFQSDEDRLVKQYLRDAVTDKTPVGLPTSLPEFAPEFIELTHKAKRPTAAEMAENSRAASVRLRAVERVNNNAQANRGKK